MAGKNCHIKLKDAYVASMALAERAQIECIAFSLLSVGVFRGNKSIHDLLKIAIVSIIESRYDGLKEIHLCGHTEHEFLLLIEVAYELALTRV